MLSPCSQRLEEQRQPSARARLDGVASCSITSLKHAASANKAGHSPELGRHLGVDRGAVWYTFKKAASQLATPRKRGSVTGDPARMNPVSVAVVTFRGI